jgi:hypothetical protein
VLFETETRLSLFDQPLDDRNNKTLD